MFQAEVAEEAVRPFAQVRNLQPVGKDVVAVVTHQRVGVENHRADAAHDDQGQSHVVDVRMGRRVPPDPHRDGGDDQFDVDAGGADDDAMPFIRQRPGVGDVAIEGRRQAQQQRPHLVDLAAEALATESVAELVDHLDHRQGRPQIDDGAEGEKLVVVGQLIEELGEVDADQTDGAEHQADAEQEKPHRENPADRAEHLVKNAVGVDDWNFDVENVGEGLNPFAAFLFPAAVVELLAGARRFVLGQAAGEKLLGETFHVLQFQPVGAELGFISLLRVFEGVLAVEELEQEMLVFLEAVVTQTNRVFDDVISPALRTFAHRWRGRGAGGCADSCGVPVHWRERCLP